jgi:hypothetical protein
MAPAYHQFIPRLPRYRNAVIRAAPICKRPLKDHVLDLTVNRSSSINPPNVHGGPIQYRRRGESKDDARIAGLGLCHVGLDGVPFAVSTLFCERQCERGSSLARVMMR